MLKITILMVPKSFSLICFMFFILVMSDRVVAQAWTFVKEKDGIRIYTKKEPGSSIKSFKGVADIHAPAEKVYNLIGNVKNLDWWDKNLKQIKVLYYEKEKRSQYYLVYDSPWPVTDRDLCVDATINTDPVTGIRTIRAVPLLNVVPENPACVRIKDYKQSWVLEPTGKDVVHVVLEGYVDPGGNVPDWIYNMVITDTPLKIIRGVKQRLEKQ
ncbi:MAG: START domain-containing protein [Bacteroidetes bacterium]|nr:START domain-containing protein [Bacteroidota bacterium]